MSGFTHFDQKGNAVMVDVHEKADTYRVAVAGRSVGRRQGFCPLYGSSCQKSRRFDRRGAGRSAAGLHIGCGRSARYGLRAARTERHYA